MFRAASFLLTGMRQFTKDAYTHAAKTFDNTSMNSKHPQKHVVVTGANQGLGLEVAKQLADKGCTVYMVCRNQQRGEEAVKSIQEITGNKNVHLFICDLASLKSIESFAAAFIAQGNPIHALINNAGGIWENNAKSEDGYELNFAVNTLGTYHLTKLLKPALARSAPSRVIFVSSGGMLTSPLVVDNIQNEDMKTIDGVVAYARDKRRQQVLAERLAKDWAPLGITVVSMHPGWVDTDGVRTSIPKFYETFKNSLRDVQQGADTAVWLSLEDTSKIEPGAYYLDRKPQAKHLSWFGGGTKYSEADVDQLMDVLSKFT